MMESYPGELLVGVSPLVFCVNATLASKGLSVDPMDQDPDTMVATGIASTARSQFDRFLDAMAASLLDMEPEGSNHDLDSKFSTTATAGRRRATEDNGMLGLFRGDNESLEIDSDQEDDMILGGDTSGISMTTVYGNNSSVEQSAAWESESKRTRSLVAFPRIGGPGGNNRNPMLRFASREGSAASVPSSGGVSTSFARALQEGQGFFQRARIVSISHRHGFPPSKDPKGKDNRIKSLFLGKTMRTGAILTSTKRRPIDGILPSGWLEKHAAALPSVIVVVVQVSSHQRQHEQNSLLQETLQSLQMSLASKRDCKIRVVGLVNEGISTDMAQDWKKKMTETLDGQPPLTLLDVADLQQDNSPSMTLQNFHKAVRDDSFRYYMTQARRTKHKLSELGPARGTPLLLPLCIRYCFKVAIFYEFQWNPEKSLKYMAEAYRHVETYYRYLLQQREIANHVSGEGPTDQDTSDGPKIRLSDHGSSASTDDESAGVEISLPTEAEGVNNLLLNPPNVPYDMVHQCRVLADWLNFKILQSGLTSHTAGGLLAASAQLQRHSQAFCSPLRSFVCSPDHAYIDWSFVAHQRMVASQLLERNPPRALGELGKDNDEVLLRCSPWKAYEATAEALLRLGAEVKKSTKSSLAVESIAYDTRTRYVGGLDKGGYQPKLQEELKVNHQELALDCLRRAISFYERDMQKHEQEKGDAPLPWNRSGARSYYLAGGILLGLERYSEGAFFLEKAVRIAKGWKGLEVPARRMLVKCYEKQIPFEHTEDSQALTSVLLDSYFNAEMSSMELRRALKNITPSPAGPIKWYHECSDEDDDVLPFSFSLTFPHGTHATTGDRVTTSLRIKSNLDHAVHLNSLTLLTFAGEISIPSSDLLSAKNANEGSQGDIVIQARSTIWISTSIKLPKKLDEISANDESGNGGGMKEIPVKGSFSKSPRPRTAGLTAAGGARFANEDVFGYGESLSSKSHWSPKCLGGKALRCDGLVINLYPVQTASTDEVDNIQIEVVIKKKQEALPETTIKRAAFEEDHYVSSSWKRPSALPLKLGPRCLRVLPPLADMIVTNITEKFTNGTALEGTVNRILLRLKAGSQENCSDVAIRVSCSSFLVSASGDSIKITSDPAEEEENITVVDPSTPHVRTPVLLREEKGTSSRMTAYGYEIPKGWTLLSEDGSAITEDAFVPVIEKLRSGEQTYAVFDIFRPSPAVTRTALDSGEDDDGVAFGRSKCRSDIDVSIRYRQKRSSQKTTTVTTKRRSSKDAEDQACTSPSCDENESDEVFLTQTVSIIWSQPISTTFSPGLKSKQPCGNRHPTNRVTDLTSTRHPTASALESEMVLVDGEQVTTKCTLEAAAAGDGLFTAIDEVKFEDPAEDNAPCKFTLLSGKDNSGLLYRAQHEDPCSSLIRGSKFSLAWTCKVNMTSDYLKGSVSAPLGILSISWAPCPVELPDEVKESGYSESITIHGPLLMESPLICRIMGPPCYIENAPFETTLETLPDCLEVATPFTITYHIKNKTAFDQKLNISLKETEIGANEDSNGFMVAGLATGDISLGPFETYRMSYTAVATRTGAIQTPKLRVSSLRYNTWLIHESYGEIQTLFVAP